MSRAAHACDTQCPAAAAAAAALAAALLLLRRQFGAKCGKIVKPQILDCRLCTYSDGLTTPLASEIGPILLNRDSCFSWNIRVVSTMLFNSRWLIN